MTNYASGIQASELSLVDAAPAPPGDAEATLGGTPSVKGTAVSNPVLVQALAPSADSPGVTGDSGAGAPLGRRASAAGAFWRRASRH